MGLSGDVDLLTLKEYANEIEYDLYHGYTLLDKDGHKAHFPFGYGLSYTTFNYQDLKIQQIGKIILQRAVEQKCNKI